MVDIVGERYNYRGPYRLWASGMIDCFVLPSVEEMLEGEEPIPYTMGMHSPDYFTVLTEAQAVSAAEEMEATRRAMASPILPFRMALGELNNGRVDTAFSTAPWVIRAQWLYAQQVYRKSPLMDYLRDNAVMTEEELDEVFLAANLLQEAMEG